MALDDGGTVTFTQPRKVLWKRMFWAGVMLALAAMVMVFPVLSNQEVGPKAVIYGPFLIIWAFYYIGKAIYGFSRPAPFMSFSEKGLVWSKYSVKPMPWNSLHVTGKYIWNLLVGDVQYAFSFVLHDSSVRQEKILCYVSEFGDLWYEMAPVLLECVEKYNATIEPELLEYLGRRYDIEIMEDSLENNLEQLIQPKKIDIPQEFKTNYRPTSTNAKVLEYGRKRVR